MDRSSKRLYPERNPETHAAHKREVFWQITLPLAIGILLMLAVLVAIVLSATRPVTDVSRWASVSLMWLILPSLIALLILLAITVGLVFAITQLLKVFPRYARIIQLFFERVKAKISQLSDRIAEPILRINSFWAAARRATQLGRRAAQK